MDRDRFDSYKDTFVKSYYFSFLFAFFFFPSLLGAQVPKARFRFLFLREHAMLSLYKKGNAILEAMVQVIESSS